MISDYLFTISSIDSHVRSNINPIKKFTNSYRFPNTYIENIDNFIEKNKSRQKIKSRQIQTVALQTIYLVLTKGDLKIYFFKMSINIMKKTPIIIKAESPFLTTETRSFRWAIPYNLECLNARIHNLLTCNQNCIKGKRILDIGCHIGTFMYSALELGAEFVQGIDSEAQTIQRGKELFQQLEVDKSRYNLQVEDAFYYLENIEKGSFDTVFCLGTLYYMVEPYRLLKLIEKVAKETVLIDTFTAAYAAIQGKDAPDVYSTINEETLKLSMLLTSLTQPNKKDYRLPYSFHYNEKDLSIITLPTDTLLKIWFQSLGMSYADINWKEYQTRSCTYHDLLTPEQKKSSHWADIYASGVRTSYLLKTSS